MLVRQIVAPVGADESQEVRAEKCKRQADVAREALDDFTDKATRLGRIDPGLLAAAWGSGSSPEDRGQT